LKKENKKIQKKKSPRINLLILVGKYLILLGDGDKNICVEEEEFKSKKLWKPNQNDDNV